jgi:hypothetical protein
MERDSARHVRHYTTDAAFREHRNAGKRVGNMTPTMQEARRRRDLRYRSSYAGWVTHRAHQLRGARDRIREQLDDLHREEAECLRFLAGETRTK